MAFGSLTAVEKAITHFIYTLQVTYAIIFSQVHPIFMLSVADFILAICWLLGGVLWLQTKASHYFGFCYFLAIITVVSTWHNIGQYTFVFM